MSTASYWDVIEPHWKDLEIHEGPERFQATFRALPRPIRLLLCAHWAQSEICNGGFQQFFFNSTGVLAPEAVEAYEAVGMPRLAATVHEAAALMGTPYPRERDVRIGLLEAEGSNDAILAAFTPLETLFYELVDSERGGWDSAATAFANDAG